MSPTRRFRTTWLLLLVLACGLLGRPLHEAWHLAQPIGAPSGVVAMATSVDRSIDIDQARSDAPALPGNAVDAGSDAGDAAGASDAADTADAADAGGEAGAQTDTCAWCLFHAQAVAPGHAPPSLLTHAEASPPPVAWPRGEIPARDWSVAKPRGPPTAA